MDAPIKIKDNRVWTKLEMIDPHQLAHFLFADAGMNIDAGIVRKYWQESRRRGEPWALEHEATESHIPISLYGDGATLYNMQPPLKVVGLFVTFPLWRCASTRCSRFCIFCIEEATMWKRETLDCILYRVVYSLNLLFEGQENVANGHRFALTEIRGDWSWFKQLMSLTSSWTGNKVCYLCDAVGHSHDSSRVFYNCWSEQPSWHEYDLLEFINTQLADRERPCTMS